MPVSGQRMGDGVEAQTIRQSTRQDETAARLAQPVISVVIPTYNERENIARFIPQLVEAFQGAAYEILVVDDNSPDGTGEVVQRFARTNPRVRLITKRQKEGIGAALRVGYDQAQGDIIVSSDADLSFRVEDLVRLTEAVAQGADLALGSRHTPRGGATYEAEAVRVRCKRWVSRMGNIVLRGVFLIPVHDFSANCRAIRRSVWQQIHTQENTNTLLLEMILRCHYGGFRVEEHPVTFQDRRYGQSKLRLSIEAPKFLLKMTKYRWHYLWHRRARHGAASCCVQPMRLSVETIPCNLCGADDAEELYGANADVDPQRAERLRCTDSGLGRHGRIVRCRSCGLIYANPRCQTDAILKAYEHVEDATYVKESEGRIHTFSRSLDLIERYHPQRGRLLDVGCYAGVFLQVAKSRGWQVAGVEPSQWACQVARRQGYEVHEGTLTGAPWPPASFDVVTLWDVLEHLTDPLRVLRQMASTVVPGGLVALTTVDINSLSAKLLGTRWQWLMEMHLYYFTYDTVTHMLKNAGLEVIRIEPHQRVLSLGYLWTRLEAYLGPIARGLAKCGDVVGVNDWHVTLHGGGLMTVIARKPSEAAA